VRPRPDPRGGLFGLVLTCPPEAGTAPGTCFAGGGSVSSDDRQVSSSSFEATPPYLNLHGVSTQFEGVDLLRGDLTAPDNNHGGLRCDSGSRILHEFDNQEGAIGEVHWSTPSISASNRSSLSLRMRRYSAPL
jgi:hypothetical protein